MTLRNVVVFSLVVLSGCASNLPPDVPLDGMKAAAIAPEPSRPVEVIEVPSLLPLPGQLKPPPASGSVAATDPRKEVTQANLAARIEPTLEGYFNAMQIWPYSSAALYQIYASPGRVTDIVLEVGEQLVDVSISDPVRWVIGDTKSGANQAEQIHLIVKPTRSSLKANLVVTTDRRAYYAELTSDPDTWMASVSWEYPTDRLNALKAANAEREAAQPIATELKLDQLNFRYDISGSKAPWRPIRAFDDGAKVYVQFPDGIGQGEMPPIFVIGPDGEAQLVNYRVRSRYYIVDRLFGAAELRLGGKRGQTVRIARTDLETKVRARGGRR